MAREKARRRHRLRGAVARTRGSGALETQGGHEKAGRAGTRRDEAARAYDPREHPEHRDRSPGNGRRGEKRRTRIACAARLRSISPGCAGATDEGRRANQLQAVPTPNGAGRKHEEGSTRARTRREGTRRRERSGPCENDAPHGSSAARTREHPEHRARRPATGHRGEKRRTGNARAARSRPHP